MKNTVEDWRKFVTAKALSETKPRRGTHKPGGPIISGAELQKAQDAIDRLPEDDKKKVAGMLNAFPKYQVLSALLAESNPLLNKHEAEVLEIAEAIAGIDYEKGLVTARFPGGSIA